MGTTGERLRRQPILTEEEPPMIVPKQTVDQTLWECFRYFSALDESNAAIHVSQVRYSPITFRLAEQLASVNRDDLAAHNARLLDEVLRHLGAYEEDKGR